MGSKLEQRLQEGLKDAVSYLQSRETSGTHGAYLPIGFALGKIHGTSILCAAAPRQGCPPKKPAWGVSGPQSELTAAPTPAWPGLLALESTQNPTPPSPPAVFAIDTSLQGEVLAAMLA